MNTNLTQVLIFLLVLVVFSTFISNKSITKIERLLIALSKLFPLTKISEVLIKYFENRK